MDITYILLIGLGALLLLIIGGFVLYRRSYNYYLNKRLKGEVAKRKFFNYKVFAIIMVINICIGTIAFLGTSLLNARIQLDRYHGWLDELHPRQQMISDDAIIADFEWITDGVQKLDLSGYVVTKTSNGYFECFTARANDTVISNSLMPSLVAYFKYTGGELVNPSIEINYKFFDWQNGSSVTFNEQYLFISRLYHDEILLSIDIKISVDPQGNKNPQFYSQSHFDFVI